MVGIFFALGSLGFVLAAWGGAQEIKMSPRVRRLITAGAVALALALTWAQTVAAQVSSDICYWYPWAIECWLRVAPVVWFNY